MKAVYIVNNSKVAKTLIDPMRRAILDPLRYIHIRLASLCLIIALGVRIQYLNRDDYVEHDGSRSQLRILFIIQGIKSNSSLFISLYLFLKVISVIPAACAITG